MKKWLNPQKGTSHPAGRKIYFMFHKPLLSFTEVKPSKEWPSEGRIQFEKVSLRYDSTLDPVIFDLNLVIKAGEKVKITNFTINLSF